MVPPFYFIYQAIVLVEENYLMVKFGARCDEYTRNVTRWLPKTKDASHRPRDPYEREPVLTYMRVTLTVLSIRVGDCIGGRVDP